MSFKEVKERWKAEMPDFFVSVRNLALKLGGSAVAVWVTNEAMSLELPDSVMNACKYVIVACVAITGTAQLTKKDKTDGPV